MTRARRTVLLALLLAAPCWGQQAGAAAKTAAIQPASSPEELESRYPALRDIELPEVATHTLPNGMKLYLLEDHTLPIISGTALIRTGNLFDPPEKVGLAQLTGTVQRIGGTKTRTGDEIDQELESMAASVETGIGETSGRAVFWTLKENLDRVLEIYADVLRNPAFREDKLEFAKQQMRSQIARRNDDPGGIASREYRNLVYGKDTPFGWQIEYEHLDRIERADLESFYTRSVFPANVMLAIYGDFAGDEMRAKIEALFQDWTASQPPLPPFPKVERAPEAGVYLAEKRDVNQSSIRLGHLGGLLSDADYPALEVMSTILGGGFQSRLFRRVRSELGLAYQAGASWGAAYDHPGVFQVALGTKSGSTVAAIEAAMAEIERIRSGPVSASELKTAKDSVLNGFVFNFDTREKTLGRVLVYRYWNYPDDFIFQYRQGIAAVTAEDVLRVAKQHLDPAKMKLVVVGNPDEFDQGLDALGKPVTKLDISIPVPEAERAEQDDATLSRGREVLGKAQQAAGGAEKLAAIKDISKTAKFETTTGMSADQSVQIILPGTMRQENRLPFGTLVVFVAGDTGWMQSPQGQMPLGGPQLQQAQGELFRLRETLLLSDRDPSRTVNFVKEEEVDGRPAEVIEISAENGLAVRLWIDAEQGDLLKTAYQEVAMTGAPAEVERTFSDFRDVDGIRTPFQTSVYQNGQKFADVTMETTRYNSGLDPEALGKP